MSNLSTGKMVLVGCGGAGINVVADVAPQLKELKEYSNIETRFIDTTEKTIQSHVSHIDEFYRITSDRLTEAELDGAAGERKNQQLAADIDIAAKKFLDQELVNSKGTYFVLVSSASGGSGSIIAPLLLRAMQAKGFSAIVVTIGDSSNLLSLNNTINTLTSLQAVSRANKTAQSIIYYNNTVNGVTTPRTEKDINNKIFKMLSIISVFVSGVVKDLDHQDMINFFTPTNYKTFKTAPGIYNLGVAKGELDDKNTLLARTILKEGEENLVVKTPLQHNKVGIIPAELSDIFDGYPVFLLFRKGVIGQEIGYLKEEYENLEKLKNVKYEEFDGLDDGFDDASGLVL